MLLHQGDQPFERFQRLRLIKRATGQVVAEELAIRHVHPHQEGLPIALPIAAGVGEVVALDIEAALPRTPVCWARSGIIPGGRRRSIAGAASISLFYQSVRKS